MRLSEFGGTVGEVSVSLGGFDVSAPVCMSDHIQVPGNVGAEILQVGEGSQFLYFLPKKFQVCGERRKPKELWFCGKDEQGKLFVLPMKKREFDEFLQFGHKEWRRSLKPRIIRHAESECGMVAQMAGWYYAIFVGLTWPEYRKVECLCHGYNFTDWQEYVNAVGKVEVNFDRMQECAINNAQGGHDLILSSHYGGYSSCVGEEQYVVYGIRDAVKSKYCNGKKFFMVQGIIVRRRPSCEEPEVYDLTEGIHLVALMNGVAV